MKVTRTPYQRSLRQISAALIASIILNAALIGYISYLHLETAPTIFFRPILNKEPSNLAINKTNAEVYERLSALPIEALSRLLKDRRLVEDGLTLRDLALAVLVNEKQYDVQKALGYLPKRRSILLNQQSISIPVDITEKNFDAIIDFAQRERWPITPQGMFLSLKESHSADESLKGAFYLSIPFRQLVNLYPEVDKDVLYKMAIEGDWDILEPLASLQQDFSRQSLLLKYLDQGSASAALILLQAEQHFTVKQLDDAHVLQVLQLLTDRHPLVAKFAINLVASSRSDAVKQAAMQKLAAMSEKRDFIASLIPPKKEFNTAPTPAPPFVQPKTHIVQNGDNLWKIAKQWKISFKDLKNKNNLTDETILRPGMVLQIP